MDQTPKFSDEGNQEGYRLPLDITHYYSGFLIRALSFYFLCVSIIIYHIN
jgi:hypothetical protein